MSNGSVRLPSRSSLLGGTTEESEILIPRGSFTAFRFLYGDAPEFSHISRVVLLGSIPKLWYREQSSNILKAWTKSSYSRFQKTVKDFEKVLNSGSRFGFSDIYKDQNLRRFLLLTNQYGVDDEATTDEELTDDSDDDDYQLPNAATNGSVHHQEEDGVSSKEFRTQKGPYHDASKPHQIVLENSRQKRKPQRKAQLETKSLNQIDPSQIPQLVYDEGELGTSNDLSSPNLPNSLLVPENSTVQSFHTATENAPGTGVSKAESSIKIFDSPEAMIPSNISTSSTDTIKPITPQSFQAPASSSNNLSLEPSHETSIRSDLSETSSFPALEGPKVNFVKTNTATTSRKSTTTQFLRPQPEVDPLIMPLDRKHERALERIRTVATKTRSHIKNDVKKVHQRKIFRKLLRNYKVGEIVRMEKMLVLVKRVHNTQHKVFQSFTESEPCDTRVIERWKEYIVVARTTGDFDEPIMIQFYTKNEVPHQDYSKHSDDRLDFSLSRSCLVNFYSSLDKTIAIVKKGKVFILRCHTPTSSIRWFTLFTETLGELTQKTLKIEIPKVGITINVKITPNLFDKLLEDENLTRLSVAIKSDGYHAKELPVLQYLIEKIKTKLLDAGFDDLVKNWNKGKFVLALCWRHYDRLEWLFGETLSNLFWQQSMYQTHNLELRFASHYPKFVEDFKEKTKLEEPAPIQGFLARLSLRDGRNRDIFHRPVFKFSYFYTENNLLFFCRSFKAIPPILDIDYLTNVEYLTNPDNFDEVRNRFPQVFQHNPYELDENNHIKWLKPDINDEEFSKHDEFANYEFQRRIESIVRADHVIDLLEIISVHSINYESIPRNVKLASNYAWNETMNGLKDETEDSKDSYFQLKYTSGALLTLKAPTKFIKDEWVVRLTELIKYWKTRIITDLRKINEIKLENIERLNIDEYLEATIGETTAKWENSRGFADPTIHNISSNAMYRPIVRSGILYQKPKKHSSFKNYYVVLIPGFLILYKIFVRGLRGFSLPSSHYQHYLTIPIMDCYVYSGNTSGSIDLLDRDSGIDKINLGQNSLPRIYPDGWISSEDESSRCFTLWFGPKRSISGKKSQTSSTSETSETKEFENPGLIKMINKLGITGKNMVFMCRSRQERDLWVQGIYIELERFYKSE